MENAQQTAHRRNSLIELYRFFFALWVLYYHGYFFLPKNQYFDSGFLGVDFFFILSGLFLMTLFANLVQKGFWKGIINLIWKKLKPLGITLIISLIFAQIYFWLHIIDDFGDPFGFMWYIKWLILIPVIYYAIFYLLKDKKKFLIVVSLMVVVSYVLLYTLCFEWGILRGISGIGIGILISQIPTKKLVYKRFNFNILFVIILIIGTFFAAMYKRYIPNGEHLFILFLFPALLYFSKSIDCHFAVFNYLGSLSFGMYAYQTINRLIEDFGWLNDKQNNLELFSIVMGLAIVDRLIRTLIKYHKDKNKAEQQSKESLIIENNTSEETDKKSE